MINWDETKDDIKDLLVIVLLILYIASSIQGMTSTEKEILLETQKIEKLIKIME